MTDLKLPLVTGDMSQKAALRLMARAGGAAVERSPGIRIVTSRMVIDTREAVSIGQIADRYGLPFDSMDERFGISGDHVRIDPDRVLPQFDVPAGYKQCPEDGNHTYDLDSPYILCPEDDATLFVVYLNG